MTTRRTFLSLSLGMLLGATTTGVAAASPYGLFDGLFARVSTAQHETAELTQLARQVPDRGLRRALVQQSRTVQAELDQLALELQAVPTTPQRPSRPSHPQRPYPPGPPPLAYTSDQEMGQLIGALRQEPFDDDRLAVLRDIARGRAFTSAQVERFLRNLTFDDAKVEAAVMLHGQVVDPQNWYQIYDAFTFGSSRNEVRRRVG